MSCMCDMADDGGFGVARVAARNQNQTVAGDRRVPFDSCSLIKVGTFSTTSLISSPFVGK